MTVGIICSFTFRLNPLRRVAFFLILHGMHSAERGSTPRAFLAAFEDV
jgi:hypothetical protein